MAIIDFKATKCKHCYKCVRNCEVKAIMIKDERAEIMPDKCILCGKCMQVCPQSAKTLVSDLNTVKGYIANHIPTVVSISPSSRSRAYSAVTMAAPSDVSRTSAKPSLRRAALIWPMVLYFNNPI